MNDVGRKVADLIKAAYDNQEERHRAKVAARVAELVAVTLKLAADAGVTRNLADAGEQRAAVLCDEDATAERHSESCYQQGWDDGVRDLRAKTLEVVQRYRADWAGDESPVADFQRLEDRREAAMGVFDDILAALEKA
jgi:hypothetical protein